MKRVAFIPLFPERAFRALPSIESSDFSLKDTTMDARISPLSSQSLNPISLQMKRPASAAGGGAVDGGFAGNFKNALKEVSAAQNEATRLQTQVQLGNPAVSLEETMLAMQKAQIGFQATLNVRNRMVQAYTDIMNMSV
jgi:flagellar hook-basal body complex protein FliE